MAEVENPKRGVAKVIFVTDHPYVYATLTDIKPSMGMIQIYSDWGDYSSFWSAMSDRKIAQFVTECDAGYIQRNFRQRLNYMLMKKDQDKRLAQFMIECWPRLVAEIKKDLEAEKI